VTQSVEEIDSDGRIRQH